MTVNVREWSDSIPRNALGPAVEDSASLKGRFRSLLRKPVQPTTQPTPKGPLQHYADLYGEQVTTNALADLDRYFAVMQKILTLGGLPTGYPRLGILGRGVRPSNTAVSVVGEGLAGWYLEDQLGLVPLARPVGKGPDIIFTDTGRTRFFLVQVKGTQEPDIKPRLLDASQGLIQFAHNVVPVTSSRYSCILVGVEIRGADDFAIAAVHIALP